MPKPTPIQLAACRKLGMSDKEIAEMYEDDADVDKGVEMPWDLSADEHKKAMKYANADEHKKPAEKKKPPVYNWNTDGKERKGNATKEQIVSTVVLSQSTVKLQLLRQKLSQKLLKNLVTET